MQQLSLFPLPTAGSRRNRPQVQTRTPKNQKVTYTLTEKEAADFVKLANMPLHEFMKGGMA